MANDQLDLIRTDRVALPCHHCGQQTPNVWAYTKMDAFRLSYTESRACGYRCAQAAAIAENAPAEAKSEVKRPGAWIGMRRS